MLDMRLLKVGKGELSAGEVRKIMEGGEVTNLGLEKTEERMVRF